VGWRLLWHALDIYNPWMQACLRQVAAMEKPDVASVHNLPGWSVAVWNTLEKLGIPIVQVLHDHYTMCMKSSMYRNGRNCERQCPFCRLFRWPSYLLSRRVQAVVGVSRFLLEKHLSLGYFSGVPIRQVIYNAHSPDSLGGSLLPPQVRHPGLRFGFIGHLSPEKGVDPLVEIFNLLDLPGSELWIAGQGEQNYEQQLIAKAGQGRVRFLGWVVPRSFYPEVDVVVVPSLCNDSLPGVIFESLAFGRPVIASRRGGIPEMIRDGENGLLFDPDKSGELAGCLRRMHEDTDLRARLTAAARPSSAPFLGFQRWVGQHEKVYRDAIGLVEGNLRRSADAG
jgi:glycosyltransferase involved in cell wall biosynthesis